VNIPSQILTLLAGIALTLISLWYGQNHGLMPVQASDDAVAVDGLFNAMMTVSMGIFLLVQGVLIFSIFKFRRRAGDETDGPPIEGNVLLEIVWTAIPVVIVLVISVYSFDVYKSMGGFDPEASDDPGLVQVAMMPDSESNAAFNTASDTASAPLINAPRHHHHHSVALGIGASPETANKPADVTVNVLGMQYAWIFSYPESGITSGELHIPVDKDVKLTLKAQDVIHAFWLPEFRLKQDTIPGQDSELRFVPRRVGDYPIVCAELCGAYHGGMVSRLYVQTQEDYDQWVQSQVALKDSQESAKTSTVASLDAIADPTPNMGDRATTSPDPIRQQISQKFGIDDSLLNQVQPATPTTATPTTATPATATPTTAPLSAMHS
jgi:cytochrome c oxidase subunit 2